MTIIFLLLGLIIGSFLNAVVYRLEAVESLLERSHCVRCKKTVRWFDNVPLLSFILLGAKCRDCGEKISWQYPIVEIVTGALFFLIGKYFFDPLNAGNWLTTFFLLTIISISLIIFVYDLKYMEIPMLILWLGVGVTLVYLFLLDARNFAAAGNFFDLKLVSGILGGLVAGGFFFGLAAFSKETWMGWGDVYLGLLIGLIVGWPNILLTLLVSFVLGALISVGLVVFSKKTLKSQVPFAPFLISAFFLVLLLPQIFPQLENYLLLFG